MKNVNYIVYEIPYFKKIYPLETSGYKNYAFSSFNSSIVVIPIGSTGKSANAG